MRMENKETAAFLQHFFFQLELGHMFFFSLISIKTISINYKFSWHIYVIIFYRNSCGRNFSMIRKFALAHSFLLSTIFGKSQEKN